MSLIKKYTKLTYEQRLILIAIITTTASCIMAVGKLFIGFFTDYTMVAVGAFNLMLVAAKVTCIVGAKRNRDFKKRNLLTAVFLFLTGVLYSIYMSLSLFFDIPNKEYTLFTSVMTAAIAFGEMGIAIYGLVRTKSKSHDYRNLKIISFITAIIAIMTAQIAILSFNGVEVNVYNSYTGISIGIITMLLAIYIYFAPQISRVDREYNVFRLIDENKNNLVEINVDNVKITLCKSKIYGSIVYNAKYSDGILIGSIEKEPTFWKNLNILVKILFIILSEILIFVWAIGYSFYFIRTIDLPNKLKRKLVNNGFECVYTGDLEGYNIFALSNYKEVN